MEGVRDRAREADGSASGPSLPPPARRETVGTAPMAISPASPKEGYLRVFGATSSVPDHSPAALTLLVWDSPASVAASPMSLGST